nr:hypothetical protein [Corynebacterium lactis]
MPHPSHAASPGAFTLMPGAITDCAGKISNLSTQADASCQAASASADLCSLGDAAFVGEFFQAAAQAISAQGDQVSALSSYGAGASQALRRFAEAAVSAEEQGASRFCGIAPAEDAMSAQVVSL